MTPHGRHIAQVAAVVGAVLAVLSLVIVLGEDRARIAALERNVDRLVEWVLRVIPGECECLPPLD